MTWIEARDKFGIGATVLLNNEFQITFLSETEYFWEGLINTAMGISRIHGTTIVNITDWFEEELEACAITNDEGFSTWIGSRPKQSTECTRESCPDILNGHSLGCGFYREGL